MFVYACNGYNRMDITEWRNIKMKYFGTDGFRGEANAGLNVIHAYKVGRFLGWYYGQEHKARIIIGKDTRRSSYMFEDALSAGLTASGADVYLLHVTPTPSVSYVVRTEQFDCGIMISASHNPYYDNGLKVINGNGYKLEAAIGRHRYIGYLMSLATRSFKNIRVGLDCANGSSYSVAKGVFDALGAKTYTIGMEPDGLNINDGCGSTHIEKLHEFVKEKNLDIGFAYDGDADRCLAVDDQGEVIDGDAILYICGCYLKEKGELNNNTVVTTVMSNLGLYKALDKAGIAYEKTAVGDKYVNANMMEHGHSLGGEQSGHIIFSKYAVTGDGVLTSLMLMEVMLEKKTKLSELRKDLKIYPQLLKNVKVTDKTAAINDAYVLYTAKEAEKALGENGRILLRESGTEPLVRVMVEAETQELCEKYVDSVVAVLEDKGFVTV